MARAPRNAKAQNEKVDSSNTSDFNKFVKEYGPDLAMLAIPGLGAAGLGARAAYQAYKAGTLGSKVAKARSVAKGLAAEKGVGKAVSSGVDKVKSAVQARRDARGKMKTSDKPKTASEQDLKNVKEGVEDMKKRTVTTPRKATPADLQNIKTGTDNLRKRRNRSRAIKGTAAAVGAGTIAHGLMSGSQEDSESKDVKTNPKLSTVKVPVKPKTIEKASIDKLKSVKRPTKTSQEAKERSSVKTAKKKRDRLFGLDFLPEIDSKEGGDKVNLPFGLGSYETLPQKDDLSEGRKKGGSVKRKSGGSVGRKKASCKRDMSKEVKRKSGGKVRKAGCKRGMGKALRGY